MQVKDRRILESVLGKLDFQVLKDLGVESASDLLNLAPLKIAYSALSEQTVRLKGEWMGLNKNTANTNLRDLKDLPVKNILHTGDKTTDNLFKLTGAKTIGELGQVYNQLLARISSDVKSQQIMDPTDRSSLPIEKRRYQILDVEKASYPSTTSLKSLEENCGFSLENGDSDVNAPCFIMGHLLTFQQTWSPLPDFSKGHVLYSRGLAPAEQVNLAVVDWSRRDGIARADTTKQSEILSNQMEHNRAIDEVARATANEIQTGVSDTTTDTRSSSSGISGGSSLGIGVSGSQEQGSASAGASSGFGGQLNSSSVFSNTFSTSTSMGNRNVFASFGEKINDISQQHASSDRSRRASTFVEIEQGAAESITTRSIRNYNHSHTLNIVFSEIVQQYRVAIEPVEIETVLMVRMVPPDNWIEVSKQYKDVIAGVALDARVIKALEGRTKAVLVSSKSRFSKVNQTKNSKTAADVMGGVNPTEHGEDWRLLPDISLTGLSIEFEFDAGDKQDVVVIATVSSQDGTKNILTDTFIQDVDGDIYEPNSNIRSEIKFDVLASDLNDITVQFIKFNHPVKSEQNPDIYLKLEFSRGRQSFTYDLKFDLTDVELGDTELAVEFSEGYFEDLEAWLNVHLKNNSAYYSRHIWSKVIDDNILGFLGQFSFHGEPLVSQVASKPIGVSGEYLIFKYFGDWKYTEQHKSEFMRVPTKHEVIPIATGGFFAEGYLGDNNISERIDLERFWNWKDSPIPDNAPQIAPLQAGARAQSHSVETAGLEPSSVQLMAPTQLPNPGSGLSDILSTVAMSNMFRDMSGRDTSAQLAATALTAASQLAAETGGQSSQNFSTASTMASYMAALATSLQGGKSSPAGPTFGGLNATEFGGLKNAIAGRGVSLGQLGDGSSSQQPQGPQATPASLELPGAIREKLTGELFRSATNFDGAGAEQFGINELQQDSTSTDQDSAPPNLLEINRRLRSAQGIIPASQDRPNYTPGDDVVLGQLLFRDFSINGSELTAEHREGIKLLAQMISKPGSSIFIEGRASQTGPEQNNFRLSSERAHAISNLLIQDYQVPVEKFVDVISLGSLHALQDSVGEELGINRSARVSYRVPIELEDVLPVSQPDGTAQSPTSRYWGISFAHTSSLGTGFVGLVSVGNLYRFDSPDQNEAPVEEKPIMFVSAALGASLDWDVSNIVPQSAAFRNALDWLPNLTASISDPKRFDIGSKVSFDQLNGAVCRITSAGVSAFLGLERTYFHFDMAIDQDFSDSQVFGLPMQPLSGNAIELDSVTFGGVGLAAVHGTGFLFVID